jgi:hypothetical protein
MGRKRTSDACIGCGGTETIEATDNHGDRYIGCARCVIVDPAAECAREERDAIRIRVSPSARFRISTYRDLVTFVSEHRCVCLDPGYEPGRNADGTCMSCDGKPERQWQSHTSTAIPLAQLSEVVRVLQNLQARVQR